MTAPVPRERLLFPAGDAFAFNTARETWRREAAATKLPSAARRVAAILPDYLNFEYGYCWPGNDELIAAIGAKKSTVENGLATLDKAGLIERQTTPRHDEKGEVIGRNRRIWLTRPTVNPTVLPEVNPTVEVNPTPEKVNPTPRSEPYTGVGNIPDKDISYEDRALPPAYVRTHAGVRVNEIPSFPDRLSAGVWLGAILFPGDEIFDQCVDAVIGGTLTLESLAQAQAVCYPAGSAI